MRRWKELALAGALIGLVLLGLRGLIGDSRTRERALPETSATDAPAPADARPIAPLEGEALRRESAGSAPTPTTPAAPRGQNVETLAPGAGVQVLVRMKHDLSPVPGALVAFVDFDALEPRRRAELTDPNDRDAAAARYGRLFRADEHGIAVVPRSEQERFVECSANGAWGRQELSIGLDEPVPLELVPDSDLRVRVVDPTGAPAAGVRVVALYRRDDRIRPMLFATTEEPDGVATLRHVRATMRAQDGSKAFVGLAIPLAEPVEREFDPKRTTGEPLELQLPATGSLEILLEEPDGTLHGGLAWLLLNYGSKRITALVMNQPIRNGRLVLPHVGLGLSFSASVAGEDFVEVAAQQDGPRVAGERTTLRLAIGKHHPVVTARLVAAGTLEPLSNAAIDVLQEGENARGSTAVWSSTRAQTDAAGRIRLVVVEPQDEIVRRTLVFVARPEDEGEELSARVELARTLPQDENELGDVLLAPREVLVAGTVLDERGLPVAGACVQVRPLDEEEFELLEGLAALGYANSAGDGELQAVSGADGRFEIRGELDSSALGVTAWREGYSRTQEPVGVRRGERDVVVVLRRAGAVAGHVLVDAAIGARWVRLVLTAESGDASQTKSDVDTGFFLLESVEPGRYSLVALAGSGGDEVARVDGLVVAPGETARHPRFDPLDLRGKLRSLRIDARCNDELPVPHYQVLVLGSEPDSPLSSAGWGKPGRPVQLVTALPALDLRVQAPEHKDVTLLGVTGDREALLEAGIPIRIVFTGELPRLDPSISLEANLGVKASPFSTSVIPSGSVDAAGVVELRVGAAGTFEVGLLLQSEQGTGIPVEQARVPIEVRDQKELQEFQIAVNEGAIEAAIAVLARALAGSGG